MLAQLFRPRLPVVRRSADLFDLADLGRGERRQNEAQIRALCAPAYLGGDDALARVLGRYKMFVDTGDVGHSSHLLIDGYWEMWTTEALAAVVRPGMTCIDVGANLGYFTVLMADLVGDRGHVLAVEPNPPIAARLRDTLAVNGFDARTTVLEIALGRDDHARVRLMVPAREPKNAHVLPVDPADTASLTVASHRLDGIAAALTADVVKIDADTAEEAIWDGMAGLFAAPRPQTIFLEFAAARYPDPAAFLGRIVAAGFGLARLHISHGVCPVDAATVLAAPPQIDQMLVLTR